MSGVPEPFLPAAPLPGALLALLLALPLASCSDSRFGESLSRSFSAPEPPAASAPAASASLGDTATAGSASTTGSAAPSATSIPAATPANAPGAAASPGSPAAASGGAGSSANGATAPRARSSNRPTAAATPAQRSAPYRVTLLLPQADAAAPAEVVTQALRAAGVPFEVETIERLSGGSGAAAGSGTSPATLPGRRPAPEPR